MRPEIDPACMTPDEQFREVAAILAAGLRRLRDRSALALGRAEHSSPENLPETGPRSP